MPSDRKGADAYVQRSDPQYAECPVCTSDNFRIRYAPEGEPEPGRRSVEI